VSVIRVKVQVAKNKIVVSAQLLSLLWRIGATLCLWVAYINRQLRIAIQVSVIKVEITVAKNRKSASA